MATLAKGLQTLRQQVNAAHPGRSKASDGTFPSAAHLRQNPRSDHNTGHALDLTHDPRGGFDAHRFAEHLRQAHDPRIKYIISNRRIASAPTFQWRKYVGKNAHDKHIHISVSPKNDHPGQWRMPARVMSFADIPDPGPNADALPPQENEDGLEEAEQFEGVDVDQER